MIVLKFGGTSVSSQKGLDVICGQAKSHGGKNIVIVVSALSGVTDLLLSLTEEKSAIEKSKNIKVIKNVHFNFANKIFKNSLINIEIKTYISKQIRELEKLALREIKKKNELDMVCSFGEIISSFIISKYLQQNGIKSQQVIATSLIVTNSNFTSADFIPGLTKKKVQKVLKPLIKNGFVPVVTGFLGANTKGEVTTLGRGGSDYSATIIAFSLAAEEIQIWTDVDGIFSADPKKVNAAKIIPEVSFREASELATFGAKVLHPRTIKPATSAGIPVKVLNTFNPAGSGTKIVEKIQNNNRICAIASKKNIKLVNIYSSKMLLSRGFLAKVFSIFSKNNISVDLVSVSEVSISVTLDNDENLDTATSELSKFCSVSKKSGLGMVSIIGEGVASTPGRIQKVFEVLSKKGILVEMVSLGATDINVSLVIKYDRIEAAVEALHANLIGKN